MKKYLILLCVLLLSTTSVLAKDYAKLQVKEMKHAQKYGTTNKYFSETNKKITISTTNKMDIKDPKIMKIGNYEPIDNKKYAEKISEDEINYKKIAKSLSVRNVDNYNAQAKGEDYYKVYRITEKIIRANKLDYLNWRIGIYRDADNPNAYSTNMNYVAISTSLYDTFENNEDALAMIIGHEMGHALLGHQQRSTQTLAKLQRAANQLKAGNGSLVAYQILKRKYLIDSKNMEYAADVEGAKLAAKAGYNIDKGTDVLSFINTLAHDEEFRSDHPNGEHRLENLRENRKYFAEEEWAQIGKYNIYNSEVLPVKLSSDRKSIVISSISPATSDQAYRPETMDELYARLGYKSYVNGEFDKSIEYFEELFEINTSNAPAYLYASYASEALYKQNGKEKYLQSAKEYAKKAKQLDSTNKYINEQFEGL